MTTRIMTDEHIEQSFATVVDAVIKTLCAEEHITYELGMAWLMTHEIKVNDKGKFVLDRRGKNNG